MSYQFSAKRINGGTTIIYQFGTRQAAIFAMCALHAIGRTASQPCKRTRPGKERKVWWTVETPALNDDDIPAFHARLQFLADMVSRLARADELADDKPIMSEVHAK